MWLNKFDKRSMNPKNILHRIIVLSYRIKVVEITYKLKIKTKQSLT